VEKSLAELKKGYRRSEISPGLAKFIIIINGLLKMTEGQSVPDPDLKLINEQSFKFAKSTFL
jgi:hypothetical protein